MAIESIIVSETLKASFSLFKSALANLGDPDGVSVYKIESHIKDCLMWSSSMQFWGMAESCPVETKSISIDIESNPRKFRDKASNTFILNEKQLISNNNNFILLGDPGAGKTTTIKRLTKYLITTQPEDENDTYQFPIVVRFRELKKGEPLLLQIAKKLGIHVNYKIIENGVGDQLYKECLTYIGKQRIEDALPAILDHTHSLIFLDGLDEIENEQQRLAGKIFSNGHRESVENEIASLARKLLNAKIIITCRSGDYSTHIEGFNIVELCSLTKKQRKNIIYKWADNPAIFWESLKKSPYQDLTDRPLLLTQLIVLFNQTGFLPEQAIDIYEKMSDLLLEKWDQNRKVKRYSRYGNFSTIKKARFLSALSFDLLYVQKRTRFNKQDLIKSYLKWCEKFELNNEEAELVIEEIESHTGLIIKSGHSHYEFSHLSFQEYFCAKYLLNSPFSDNLKKYLYTYPAPLAISIALSPESSAWFSMIILLNYENESVIYEKLTVLLERIKLEGVRFQTEPLLGFALLKLLTVAYKSIHIKLKSLVIELVSNENCTESIKKALSFSQMNISETRKNSVTLSRRCQISDEYKLADFKTLPPISTKAIGKSLVLCKIKILRNILESEMRYFG